VLESAFSCVEENIPSTMPDDDGIAYRHPAAVMDVKEEEVRKLVWDGPSSGSAESG
jgi:hypothetical protein